MTINSENRLSPELKADSDATFSPEAKEKLAEAPNFQLIIARHAEYSMDEDHPEGLGHLTETGEVQAQALGLKVLAAAGKLEGDVDISFIASSQKYDSPKYPMYDDGGRRAEETATVAMEQIAAYMTETGDESIRLLSPMYAVKPRTSYNDRLVEGDIFYIPFSPQTGELNENPMGYVKSLRANNGKDWKEAHLRGSDEVSDAVAKEIGAETSIDIAHRTMSVVEDVAELARLHAEREPGKSMLFVLIAHDGVIRSLLQHELGVGDDSNDYLPSHTESVELSIGDGNVATTLKGKVYNRHINQ